MKVEILTQKEHNFLWIDDYLWMWDIPVERRAHKEIASNAYGRVLVAGYGFGIVQEYLLSNPKVESVLTIEISGEVINKVKEIYGKIYGDIIIGDFYDYNSDEKFDCVVGDVWKDIDSEALEDYKKFKLKSKSLLKENGQVLAWGKNYFEYLLEKEDLI